MKFKYLEDYSYVREQKKLLPYTVTELSSSAEFKARQAQKELEAKARFAAKRAAIIKGMEDGSLIAKHQPVESETTKAYKRYYQNQEAIKLRLENVSKRNERNDALKPSLFTRIYNWCMDKFLSVNL